MGDIVRMYHYTDRRTKRKCYMYKIVMRMTKDRQFVPDGEFLRCVDILGIGKHCDLNLAYSNPIEILKSSDFEIIDGFATKDENGNFECWYERPKVTTEKV